MVIEYGCLFVCMFVCTFVCLYVCLYVCWICAAWSSLIRYTCCTWEEAEFIGGGPYRKINSAPPTRLPFRAKTYATSISFYNCFLISFYNFFLQIFSYLTSLLIKCLTRYILLYICNNYKRLIESLTTCILLYICNKYKKTYRIPNDIYLIIYL